MVTSMGAAGAKHPIDLEMRWNFGDSRGTSLSLDEFLAQKEAASVEFFAATGRSCWDHGLTAVEMRRRHRLKPMIFCQVEFREWTRDDRLRQPVFLGIREDKNANEVVLERAS